MDNENLNVISKQILEASITVHKEMGPGLLESVYQQCLVKELSLRKIKTEALVTVPLQYKGYTLNKDYVIDVLVENEIILELKAVEIILPVMKPSSLATLNLLTKN